MDITLLPHILIYEALEGTGFNPCFNGYYTSTQTVLCEQIKTIEFQSLF